MRSATRHTATMPATSSNSSRHLAALIGDVIEFARVEQAGLKLYDQPIDAVELLEVCVKMCRQDARCKNIAIALLAEVSGVEVVGDVTRLRQVLVNLLSNAVKFTPPEGHVEARLSRSAEGDLEFRITDTGIGMERHQLKRIFEPFVQGDAGIARRFGGIGLGLPIARKLARLHGGDVTIEFEVRRRDGCHVRGAGVTGQASPIKIARAGQSLGGDAHDIVGAVTPAGEQRFLALPCLREVAGLDVTIAADLFGNGGDLGSERQIGRAQAGQQLPDALCDRRRSAPARSCAPRCSRKCRAPCRGGLRKGASSLNAVIIHGPNFDLMGLLVNGSRRPRMGGARWKVSL